MSISYRKYAWVALPLIWLMSSSCWGAATETAGSWTDPATWVGGAPPDQSANGGNGEEVFINHSVTAASGVDFVSTTTIDPSTGNPADGNIWMFFDITNSPTLTIQDGARVGSLFWTQVGGTGGTATVDIQSGGEYFTAGINNSAGLLNINVQPGGTLTLDASIHPNFGDVPNQGFYRGHINAGTGATNNITVEGTLNVVDINNSDTGDGTNTFTLSNGGVINEAPFGVPGGGSISYDAIAVAGTGGTIQNAFAGDNPKQIPAGLVVDVSNQTVLGSSGPFATDWANWVTANGGDPNSIGGPRRAQLDSSLLSGSGTIQLDVHGFEVLDNDLIGDPSDDTLGDVFRDDLNGGPTNVANNTFTGDFVFDYVGPEITDQQVDLINSTTPALLIINGRAAVSTGFHDNLEGLPVPSQVWSDGARSYDVTFSDIFFNQEEIFPGVFVKDTALPFTLLTSITPIDSPGLPGDFNGDGAVNLADYTVWRDNLGATEDGSILNGNGTGSIVDVDDYALWKASFGNSGSAAIGVASSAVPEPSTLGLLGALAVACGAACRPRKQRFVN